MNRNSQAAKTARSQSTYGASSSLHYCGFECPGCSFQHRLSDSSEGKLIIDLFRSGSEVHALRCPECGRVTSYGRSDLKLFGSFRD